jgi:pimeloyl-ACP methyl ester carboxylesterase
VAPEDSQVTAPLAETETLYVIAHEENGEPIILNGRFFGSQNEVAVILTHMRPNDQTAWFEFAETLADAGYAAVTFDFRGYGESEGNQDFAMLDDDLMTVLQYVRDRGKERVFLVGASMGGTTSLVVAAGQEVEGVVTLSAPSQFEDQDALAAMPAVFEPALLIAAQDDTQAMISMDELVEAAEIPVETETYPGTLHGTALIGPDSEHTAAVEQRIITFLEAHQ